MTNEERKKGERRGGAAWFGGASFESGLRWVLSAPEAWLARAGIGAGVALNLAWLASIVATPPRPDGKLPLFADKPAYDLRDALYSPRAMITGFKHILAPDFAASQPAPERADAAGSASADAPPPGYGLETSSRKEGEAGGKAGEEGKEGAGEGKEGDPAAAAAAVAGKAAGGAGGAAGGLAGMKSSFGGSGGAGGGASSSASLPVSGEPAAQREKSPIGVGRKMIARGPVRSRGAMDQLKFAQNQSNRGRLANSSERSYQAADNAFQGQTAQAGGIPAVAGSPAPGAPPMVTQQGGPRNAGPDISCPPGTHLINGNACKPIETRNVTPYQGLVDLARKFLWAAAILAVLGLFLLIKGGPGGQLMGGLLLGAALALALAAVAIGNTIEKEYGQVPQKKAIEQGADKSLKGR